MLIPVLFIENDEFQEIPDYLLDRLISMGKIRSFRRSSGWVVIGRDPIRQPFSGIYTGPERRRRALRSCIMCPDMIEGNCVSTNCPDRYRKAKFYS